MEMKNHDGRKSGPKALGAIRVRAVDRVQAGERSEKGNKTLGFTRARRYNWLARYRNKGLNRQKTGSRNGRPRNLIGSQIAWIYKAGVAGDPLPTTFSDALWTRSLVAAAIKTYFHAHQRNPEAVNALKPATYPERRKKARI